MLKDDKKDENTDFKYDTFYAAAICVAGFGSDRNEILELHLPPKLFADENKVTINTAF